MATLKCKMCGGNLDVNEQMFICTCQYCNTTMTIPKQTDEQKANLFNRANHFRRSNDFDKALASYETILNMDSNDAEAYWGVVLCKYGIEYVEDPQSRKRVPTCHRTQFSSILMDSDYMLAIENAEYSAKALYEDEAKKIDEIQKGILEISSKEAPFDVFICYKETDSSGAKTKDSVFAQDIYYQLTEQGYKVFFSKITLENKLGTAYEPYIFAAINSSKVMVVVGTKQEYFNSVWVKNEWSRYLSLIKNGAKKLLIPAYRDIDPYDLPDEFSHLQALDMGKIGFVQDLVRGIKKILEPEEQGNTISINSSTSADSNALLKRAYIFLEDNDFEMAYNYFDKVLDKNPECSDAYWGLLLVSEKCRNDDELIANGRIIDNDKNYLKAVKFSTSLENKYFIVNQTIKQNYQKVIDEINRQIAEIKESIRPIREEINNLELQLEDVMNKKINISEPWMAELEEFKKKNRLKYDMLLEEKKKLTNELENSPFLSFRRTEKNLSLIDDINKQLEEFTKETNYKENAISCKFNREELEQLELLEQTLTTQIQTQEAKITEETNKISVLEYQLSKI